MSRHSVYIFSPMFYLCVAYAGRAFTSGGLFPWYEGLKKPLFTPPSSVIGIIWTLIYIMTAISLIILAQHAKGADGFWSITGLYVLNGMLNIAWSYPFFSKHLIGYAVIDAGLISLSLLLMIVFAWRYSHLAAILLMPYVGWVSFATFLTLVIYTMN